MTSGILRDEGKWRVTLDAFRPAVLAQVVALHASLTGMAQALSWLAPSTVPAHGGEFTAAWALLPVQLVAMLVAGRYLRLKSAAGFFTAHLALSVLNFAWLGLLAWMSPGFLSSLLVALLGLWAYHDAWVSGGTFVRRGDVALTYGLAAPTIDLALLVVDATGGRGLLWSWANERAFFLTFLTLQLVLTALVQWMIARVAAEVAERDARAEEQAGLERQLAVLRRERETVQATAALLGTGLMASKVSHDLASPTSVLRLDIEALARLAPRVADDARPEFEEVVADLGEVARQITELTAGVAQAVREREVLGPRPVGELVEAAISNMRSVLRAHRAVESRVNLAGADHACWVCPGHVSTLGNLLTNCALHSSGRDIDIAAVPAGEYFLRVSIRDRGVDGEARTAALLRLNRLLALGSEAAQESRGAGYRGFGVALILAKFYLIRYNGALAVRAAPDGPGLSFELVFPTVDPSSIPPHLNAPESALPTELSRP